MSKKVISWLIPLFIAIFLFIAVRPTLAQLAQQETDFADYLLSNNVEVESEVVNGYHQVYYIFQDNKTFITNGSFNSTLPDTEGEYIVYRKSMNGVDQIFLYNLVNQLTIQLTASGNNTNPRISQGKVVWEGWTNDGWQVFFFDGKSVRQLTTGDLSMNPEIEGDNIIYGRKDVTETWRAVVYSISRNETQDITTGIAAKHPALENGKIILGRVGGKGGEEFPLTVDDLFLLDLVPLTVEDEIVPETVTEEEIIEELEATPSAEIIDTATPSGEIQ